MRKIQVYGIGNPLIDVIVDCCDEELKSFALEKGTMNLVEPSRVEELLSLLKQREFFYSSGGSCPNTMIAIAGLGTKTAFSGALGSDKLGKRYEQQLIDHQVVSCVSTHPGPTGTSLIMITPDAERTMNTHLGVCGSFGVPHVHFCKIEEAEYFYFTGYMWDRESQKAAIKKALIHARESDTKVVFDAADPLAVERNRDDFLFLLENHVDIAFANRGEGELLFGCSRAEESAQALSRLVQLGAIKDGASGSLVVTGDGEISRIEAIKAEQVVDTTGAGDIYAAGFLHALCKGLSPLEAGTIASYAATRIIGQMGARLGKNDVANIKAFIDGKSSSYRTSFEPKEAILHT